MSAEVTAALDRVLRDAGIDRVPYMRRPFSHRAGELRPGFVVVWESDLPRSELPGWDPADAARFGDDPDERPQFEQHIGWLDPSPRVLGWDAWLDIIVRDAPRTRRKLAARPVRVSPVGSLPLTPGEIEMTGAEFRTLREWLGLTTRWVADDLGVAERSVHRWESGDYPVPEGVAIVMLGLRAETVRVEQAERDDALSSDPPAVVTYRTNTALREHRPGLHWPASWHRALCARIAEAVPGLRVEYWDP